ncbi:hypothetical protein AAY473_037527 [Plecturocebus cupreus]
MLRREAKRRSANQEASEVPAEPPEAERSPVARHRPQRTPTFRIILLFKPQSSGAGEKGGDGRPAIPLTLPSCLPTFSEPPCPTTSSSWKLPLGLALRMPNSISQGTCQQLGLGFEEQSLCDWRGPPATLFHHRPRRGCQPAAAQCPNTRGHLLLDPGRRSPAEAGNRADTPATHARPPARAPLRRPQPSGFLRHPVTIPPTLRTVGIFAPSSPHPAASARSSGQITSALEPAGLSAPARGRRRKRVWPGHQSPRLSGSPACPARPGPLPGRCLLWARGACSAPSLRTGDLVSLQPSRRSDSSGGGGQEQANPAPPGAQRGNGLLAAHAAAAAAPGCPASTDAPCQARGPRSDALTAPGLRTRTPTPGPTHSAFPGRPLPHLPSQVLALPLLLIPALPSQVW